MLASFSRNLLQLNNKGGLMSQTNIWWIRRDIRLNDNQTLHAALEDAEYLVPLFIIELELMAEAALKRRSFLLSALADLDRQLRKRGSQLILRQGPASKAFQSLREELEDMTIYAHEDFNSFARHRDEEIKANFKLGKDYPERIVDHKFARLRTLDAYKSARSG
jgi:deoxyribodipyrimidine photo-lyase